MCADNSGSPSRGEADGCAEHRLIPLTHGHLKSLFLSVLYLVMYIQLQSFQVMKGFRAVVKGELHLYVLNFLYYIHLYNYKICKQFKKHAYKCRDQGFEISRSTTFLPPTGKRGRCQEGPCSPAGPAFSSLMPCKE